MHDVNQPMQDNRPKSPSYPPPGYFNAPEQLRKDADKFSKGIELQLFSLQAMMDRVVTARVDRLKVVETDGENYERIKDVAEEVDALEGDCKERFDQILTMVRLHRAFVQDVAKALEH